MIAKVFVLGVLGAGMAMGQSATAPASAKANATAAERTEPAKAYRFEVVSIRPNISSVQGDMGKPTADGYRMTNSSLQVVVNTAYVPQTAGSGFYSPGQVTGLPDWAGSEGYDIDARISDEDRAAWQNPAEQKVMLRSMLQAMLAERCKLAVHREVKEASVYSLVVGKGGIKFKQADPAVVPPSGMKWPGGGVVVNTRDAKSYSMSFYGTPITSLASFLSNILSGMGHHEGMIQDKTGLTGLYDFVIKFPPLEPRRQGEGQEAIQADDPSLMAFTAAKALGLKLEPTKGEVETLIIDHMERPSKN